VCGLRIGIIRTSPRLGGSSCLVQRTHPGESCPPVLSTQCRMKMKPEPVEQSFDARNTHHVPRLIWELRESDRIIKADAAQIHALGERIKRLESALKEIIESETAQSVRSYGLGDIARDALTKTLVVAVKCHSRE
jgi:hypothetical protein